jgi:diguanylate cyclase (GGDEF)-like protein/PAS domain S-box-containing protein
MTESATTERPVPRRFSLRRAFFAAVPAHFAPALAREQADDLAPIALACGLVCALGALLVYGGLLNVPGLAIRDVLVAGIVAACPVVGLLSWRQIGSRGVLSERRAQTYISGITIAFFVMGLCWGGLLVQPVSFLSWPQRIVLAGANVFCLAVPIMITPIGAAAAMWAPMALGAMAGTILTPNNDPVSLPGMLLFVALSVFCTLFQNRRQVERIVATLQVSETARALEEKTELVSLLLNEFEENAADWLWEVDADLRYKNVSARFAKVAGKTPEEMNGQYPSVVFGKPVPQADDTDNLTFTMTQAIAARQSFRDTVVPIMINGKERFWSLSGRPVFDKAGNFLGYHGVGSDISDGHLHQQQINFLVNHDTLTGLPNRTLFNDTLTARCRNVAEAGFALLYLDLDHFKEVNDSHGHAAGDAVLKEAAFRLKNALDEGSFAARLAADEFAVIYAGVDSVELEAQAERIVAALTQPYQVVAEPLNLGASLGIVLAPKDGEEASLLLSHADLAVRRAKADGRGVWRFYDPVMDEIQQARRAMLADMQVALARNEFRIDFQPVIDLTRNRIVSAEALLRWFHPVKGMMPPAEFIPMAEESGLIAPIGEWILQEACKVAATWPRHIGIAVNLSPVQLREAGLVDSIVRALEVAGLEPSRLELEITESTLLDSNTSTVEALKTLHDKGVRIALDDFGTGYSSLSYLRRFPFNKIKIDRSFVRDLSADSDDSSIVLAIIGLAERLKMNVTAEGVETTAQAELLNTYGCPQAQGYLFSRPVSAEKIGAIITAEAGHAVRAGAFGALLH